MAEVKWQARRVSDGVLVDVTGDTSGTPASAPTENALEAGTTFNGGTITAGLSIQPTLAWQNPLQAISPVGGTASIIRTVKGGLGGTDVFVVFADGTINAFAPDSPTDHIFTFEADNTPAVGKRLAKFVTPGGEVHITRNGYLGISFVATAPADAEIDTGQCLFWFDTTNGAAKIKFKGKSANGTVVNGEVALT